MLFLPFFFTCGWVLCRFKEGRERERSAAGMPGFREWGLKRKKERRKGSKKERNPSAFSPPPPHFMASLYFVRKLGMWNRTGPSSSSSPSFLPSLPSLGLKSSFPSPADPRPKNRKKCLPERESDHRDRRGLKRGKERDKKKKGEVRIRLACPLIFMVSSGRPSPPLLSFPGALRCQDQFAESCQPSRK